MARCYCGLSDCAFPLPVFYHRPGHCFNICHVFDYAWNVGETCFYGSIEPPTATYYSIFFTRCRCRFKIPG